MYRAIHLWHAQKMFSVNSSTLVNNNESFTRGKQISFKPIIEPNLPKNQ